MKEKLTIDQKIEIAKIAGQIVSSAIETKITPHQLISRKNAESDAVYSYDDLFGYFCSFITRTVSDTPDHCE
ncbi:hypothetical protein ACQE34_20825 [Escherichia coli]|uniref:hypothetical protein n=1 Tax=Escherichia TaxID=561 RepID=UPI0002D4C517|nr:MULTISPECIES: hypothetical protein [Escherichia]EHD5739563.1 hypothetical protein [Salmonella enterica]EFK4101894.1 hypothetical protein [Escherichia coli]EHK2699463.1 hypothetical protein [Escherichia coli]EHZ8622603.1 hypothetical protein [Salmonella enterica]EIR6185329.1 hypothetical protein [Escherichia coli]